MLEHQAAAHADSTLTADERRRRERKRVKANITLTPVGEFGDRLGETLPAILWNLSAKGCGVRTRSRLSPGDYFMALFPKPGSPGLQILARVRHCRGNEQSGFVVGMSFELGERPAR